MECLRVLPTYLELRPPQEMPVTVTSAIPVYMEPDPPDRERQTHRGEVSFLEQV